MADEGLVRLLAAHSDDGNQSRTARQVCLRQARSPFDESESLLHLVEQLKQALVPVQPSPKFVQNLLRQLIVTDKKEPARQPMRSYRRGVVIGAAAIGSALSVIGIVAYLVRNRLQMKARVASAG
jgi:hypothetical protein